MRTLCRPSKVDTIAEVLENMQKAQAPYTPSRHVK